MKDKNGIEICCENCRSRINTAICNLCKNYISFLPSEEAYEARIAELQKELYVVQGSECVEAQEADRLREEVKELKNKLDEQSSFFLKSRNVGKMKKENNQIKWIIKWINSENYTFLVEGYYKGKNIIDLCKSEYGKWKMYLVLNQVCEDFYHRIRIYKTFEGAKRGAERFLKRLHKELQEAVK